MEIRCWILNTKLKKYLKPLILNDALCHELLTMNQSRRYKLVGECPNCGPSRIATRHTGITVISTWKKGGRVKRNQTTSYFFKRISHFNAYILIRKNLLRVYQMPLTRVPNKVPLLFFSIRAMLWTHIKCLVSFSATWISTYCYFERPPLIFS